ncbi:MAG: hypothetical protein AB7S38_15755 [Vulcanimicrobiota bacterium]
MQTALLEQEITLRSHLTGVHGTLAEVASQVDTHERRLRELERNQPPAA